MCVKSFIGKLKKISVILLFVPSTLCAQTASLLDGSAAAANNQTTLSLSYIHLWKLGRKEKLSIGLGGRFTSYYAANQFYITAPAELTSGSASPLIIFQDNIAANIDTFFIKAPQTNCINLSINFYYHFTKKIAAAFNIDAIGFSFGSSTAGTYISSSNTEVVNAKPTPFNLLLVSDNDRGSLNSEMFARYAINERWALKLGAQFLFTEYTTSYKVQQFPTENDRFRNKSLMICVGISRSF